MRASVFMAGESIARLRHRIAAIETGAAAVAPRPVEDGRPSLAARRGGTELPFGVAAIDAALGGGLQLAALHEVRAGESRDAGAATGFAAALLSRLAQTDTRPILWVVEKTAGAEAGFPYGTGLGGFGLDPRHLILVTVTRPGETLWVIEEGLRCRGLAAVLGEIRGNPRSLDLTASRRLALRARENGVTGLLLRQSNAPGAGAETTRWQVAPRPASVTDDFFPGIGRPAWRLALERNRRGLTGTFDVEWDHERQSFARTGNVWSRKPPLSLPAPALPADRPAYPEKPRALVA